MRDDKHFPVIATSFGYTAMLRSQLRDDEDIMVGVPEEHVCKPLSQNLNLLPRDTFTYDEIEVKDLEMTLDHLTFFNENEVGVSLENFNNSKGLRIWVPVATYDRAGDKHRMDETVSMVEGVVLPFFGYSYRLDKVQFGVDPNDGEDHSGLAIEHA